MSQGMKCFCIPLLISIGVCELFTACVTQSIFHTYIVTVRTDCMQAIYVNIDYMMTFWMPIATTPAKQAHFLCCLSLSELKRYKTDIQIMLIVCAYMCQCVKQFSSSLWRRKRNALISIEKKNLLRKWIQSHSSQQ